ncbi:MAG: alpha/beta fold hydrolase [Desulfobacteraceae bacterium]|nr:alpha/beta fold hydrolase [Desulfobacteraceae bacterium]
MNPYAYRTAGYAVKALSNLSRARIRTYGESMIPKGAVIFAVNHFTRMETFLIPYYIHRLTRMPIWALADAGLFEGGLGNLLDRLGAVSTRNPHRDLLIVKSLLTGEASWVIFPEGRMVKNKKIYEKKDKEKGRFVIASPEGPQPPHTGTATLALRTEFYRARLRRMIETAPEEADRLKQLFGIDQLQAVLDYETCIVPVNVTYYPLRARENMLSRLAELFVGDLPGRMLEEAMTEGAMLISGVDIDVRFGAPIRVSPYLKIAAIQADIVSAAAIDFDDAIPSINVMRKAANKIMERYMSAIYHMTTVNHDHLFATLLRYLPQNTIDESQLRQRAYLAASLCIECIHLHRHESLIRNQISLLTDDRYNKFNNFLELAIQKKVVRKQGSTLIVDADCCASSDFHRVRVENPIAVIANEIEPLTRLQELIKDLACQPDIRIKYRVKDHLLKKAFLDFDRDYAAFFTEGQSKPKEVGRPFLIRGRTKDMGIVLLHGYMAAPLEVRALGDYLGGLGYRVFAPRLKGHGTAPEDLAASTYMEWVESMEEGYVFMREICREVVVGGFSTGAGLALDLCARVKDIAGVFAISPPLKLQDFSARFVPAVHLWNRLMKKMNVESAKREFIENHPENPHINYFRNPISGIIELDRLMDQVADRLPGIETPALVVQSSGDPVVDPSGSLKVFHLLGSKNKEYLMINYGRHGIINGDGSERVFAAVGEFLARLTASE